MSFLGKIRHFKEQIEPNLGKLNIAQKLWLYVDYGIEKVFRGTSADDYFQYNFYFLRNSARKNFATMGKMKKFVNVSNNKNFASIFKDKSKFIKTFNAFLGRDVLDMRTASRDDFKKFISNNKRFFSKPIFGKFGIDARVRTCVDAYDADKLYEELAGSDVLVEGIIEQHQDMAGFNDTSLNSFRVVTFVRADGKPCIMAGALIRLGRKGKTADNFHHGGIGALVDISTGVVLTTGVDNTGKRYICHPDSGKIIVGYKVPLWDKICETVLEAAMVVPKVRYVGWDVAVARDGRILLIEGNDFACPDLGQMSDGIGKWPEFARYMNEVKAMNS